MFDNSVSEVIAMYLTKEKALDDRKAFVSNLGILLSQTREGILGCQLGDDEIVTITFKNNFKKRVNVRMDSYTAIIRDVMKNI